MTKYLYNVKQTTQMRLILINFKSNYTASAGFFKTLLFFHHRASDYKIFSWTYCPFTVHTSVQPENSFINSLHLMSSKPTYQWCLRICILESFTYLPLLKPVLDFLNLKSFASAEMLHYILIDQAKLQFLWHLLVLLTYLILDLCSFW